jgi:hypothetical protein
MIDVINKSNRSSAYGPPADDNMARSDRLGRASMMQIEYGNGKWPR